MSVKLVVGLGNPGRQYAGTRHNVGYRVADELACRLGGTWSCQTRRRADVSVVRHGGQRVALAKPLTFMNRSGEAVALLRQFYQVELEDLLVVADDFALPLGRIRFRRAGSSGGHNGLADIERTLGTPEYPRLRIGIGPHRGEPTDFVLTRFGAAEEESFAAQLPGHAGAVLDWIERGIGDAMNRHNAPPGDPAPEETGNGDCA